MEKFKHSAIPRHLSNSLTKGIAITLLGAVFCAAGSAAHAQDQVPFGNPIEIQSAWQSTTGFKGPARLAYDGNTDGSYSNGSVTHTSGTDTVQPSWTGDLGGVVEINNIRVWNRTDSCCTSRLSNYYVLVSDQPFESDDLQVTLADPDVFQTFQTATSTTQDFDEFPVFRQGRFVRIQLMGADEPLSLAEVEVFGIDDPDLPQYITPAAMKQSSTAFGASAERALDRDVNGRFGAGSVTHTTSTAEPYWAADLGSVADISEIRIWNRTDCCTGRLSNFYVLVSDTDFGTDSLDEAKSNPEVSEFFISELPVDGDSVTLGADILPAGITGRYVRIQLQGTGPLSLAEVEVFGNESAPTFNPFLSLEGRLFVSADELDVGPNASGGIALGHWVLSFEENDTVTWFFSDVALVGTYSRSSTSDTGMIANFSGGLEVAFEFDGLDLIWDSLTYLRTSSRIDSQESLESFLIGSEFQSVEDFEIGETPIGETALGKKSLQFRENEVIFGSKDTLEVGTLLHNGNAGFRVSFGSRVNEVTGFVLDGRRLIFNFDVYENVIQPVID